MSNLSEMYIHLNYVTRNPKVIIQSSNNSSIWFTGNLKLLSHHKKKLLENARKGRKTFLYISAVIIFRKDEEFSCFLFHS